MEMTWNKRKSNKIRPGILVDKEKKSGDLILIWTNKAIWKQTFLLRYYDKGFSILATDMRNQVTFR